ncbi:ABC transporter ATP-binding protein [Rhodococcus sp. CSLK01-03]|uniref:ABC transporter ATP-binding protein n=1 Tax=Rhodococcus indonesiensis TaxID=3055869 RepID=A0ABT7RM52_9NOCA|nr:ABC transporter ATP-binding protein [Rhodococcus indonesiensis]MDM7488354.1 ABC transporter ATP-binding protein [Rhodococcus indonesiensis]
MTSNESELLPIASAGRSWRWLGAQLRDVPGRVALTVAVSVGAAIAAVVPVRVLGVLVDRVREQAPMSTLGWVVALIAAAAVVGGVLEGAGLHLVARLGETVLARLRETVLARVLTLPPETVERAGHGDVLSRVGDDVAVLAKALGSVVPQLVAALMLVVVSVAAMVGIDWRLGLAGLVALPMYALALRWYLPRSAPLYAAERVAMGERSQALVSSMHGVRTVRAYGLDTAHLSGIDAASARARDLTVGVFGLFTRFAGRANRAEFVGLAALLVAGFVLVRADAVTVGEATAAALLFHRLFSPLGLLLFTFDDVQSAGASLARLVGVADLPAAQTREDGPSDEPRGGPPALELTGVRHRYAHGPEVLHGVDLKVAPRETVALVGSTGAGKSTVAAAAAGVVTPTSGEVRIGGRPLYELGARLRRCVVVVSQEVHVFGGPLLDDVRLARPDATVDEVAAALDAVGAGEWVRALDDGVHTVVGEGGRPVTAAQAQQLALARVLIADPQVVVLDEATAEAGSAGARALEAAAAVVTRGRTALVVAHRLTQAAAADRVVVLEAGRVVEEGPHAALVAAGGRYSRLWRAWQGGA